MIKILIIADDFTGALDTGVKFSEAGARTKVMTQWDDNFTEDDAEVLVLCVPTRHDNPLDAYRKVRKVVELADGKVGTIFKKTDSALRGNVGAELTAVLEGSHANNLYFIPALPSMNRFTSGGVHYIDGISVSDSVFGKDPFEPVTESFIPELMRKQCSTEIKSIWAEDAIKSTPSFDKNTILVYDCESLDEMKAEVDTLCANGVPALLAGCSGLAQVLAAHMGFENNVEAPKKAGTLVVVCGSVNPISKAQMKYAEENGFSRIHLADAQLLDELSTLASMAKGLVLVSEAGNGLLVDTLNAKKGLLDEMTDEEREELRDLIATRAGLLIKYMFDAGLDSRLLIVGGDTLLAFAHAIDCHEYYPVCEVESGVVLFRVSYNGKDYEMISKSGGFGDEDLLVKIVNGEL
ncbi:MAG: four-carbon acid sugar kinase family protein [Lachnospiraceae bacterium]|nr:four-carbon acid sugar kinase family protein [Lachnospiraceae bacterium]